VPALDRTPWPDVTSGAFLVVPLGSCEQHGPHLPFDVDTVVAGAVVGRFGEVHQTAVVAPAVAYGASGEHEAFPGTLSIGTEALAALLVELGRSAGRWAARLLFVTGHGGNADALTTAVPQLRYEGRDVAWWQCSVPAGDAHAGRSESSLLLALRPDTVQIPRAVTGVTTPIRELIPALRAGGVQAVSSSGVLGDPTGASAAEGEQLLEGLVDRLVRDVASWQIGADGRLLG
jgi:mycofactocin system creatininase family protein